MRDLVAAVRFTLLQWSGRLSIFANDTGVDPLTLVLTTGDVQHVTRQLQFFCKEGAKESAASAADTDAGTSTTSSGTKEGTKESAASDTTQLRR